MAREPFDRRGLSFHPLSERANKVAIERDRILPGTTSTALSDEVNAAVGRVALGLRQAREAGAARMLAFGAHTIKNGLSPVLIWLIEEGWITHLATNGAGIIHDWEFAYQGASSEDVRANIADGRFGAWKETGYYLNLALAVGAYDGLGYGESIGRFVEQEELVVPEPQVLRQTASETLTKVPEKAAAAADLIAVLARTGSEGGTYRVPHAYKGYGVQAAAYRLGVPFTGHPMFGHDIIYEHPANSGAAIGRTAERDFLAFAASVASLQGGVYLSVGSAVMSPMVFEKTLSMARNRAHAAGSRIDDFLITVVDLAPVSWDWSQGEPPETHPDYYLRYNKTFARTGGDVHYVTADNRAFLPALAHALSGD